MFTFSVHSQKNFPFRKQKSDLDVGLEDEVDDKGYLKVLQVKGQILARQLIRSNKKEIYFGWGSK